MSIERVVVTGLVYGQTCQNVLHFLNPDGAQTPTQIADEIVANWIGPIRAQQMTTFTWTGVSVTRVGVPPGVTFNRAISLAGLVGGSQAIHSVLCVLIRKQTATSGRMGRGRCYISGNRPDAMENDVFNAGNLAAWIAVAATLNGRFKVGGSGPLTLQVGHGTSTSDYHGVTDLSVPNRWGIQRRRNVGVGI